jgi:hypothetical protein
MLTMNIYQRINCRQFFYYLINHGPQVSRNITSHVSNVKQLVNVIIRENSLHLIAISESVLE